MATLEEGEPLIHYPGMAGSPINCQLVVVTFTHQTEISNKTQQRRDATRKAGGASLDCHLPRKLSQGTVLPFGPVKGIGLLTSEAGTTTGEASVPTSVSRRCDSF